MAFISSHWAQSYEATGEPVVELLVCKHTKTSLHSNPPQPIDIPHTKKLQHGNHHRVHKGNQQDTLALIAALEPTGSCEIAEH